MRVNEFEPLLGLERWGLVDVLFHLVERGNGRLIDICEGLELRGRLFKEAHHFFERIFGAVAELVFASVAADILALIQLGQDSDILIVHAIGHADTLFDSRAKPDIGRW